MGEARGRGLGCGHGTRTKGWRAGNVHPTRDLQASGMSGAGAWARRRQDGGYGVAAEQMGYVHVMRGQRAVSECVGSSQGHGQRRR